MFSAIRASTTKVKKHDFRKFRKNPPKILREVIFFPFSLTSFSGPNFLLIFTDLMPKNSANFSLLNDNLLFQKYEFFIQFFCENRKNSIFREKFFGTENYRSKIAVIFSQIGVHSKNICSGDFWNISKIGWFSIFFRFFYEACRSAVFQPTGRKCMSGDKSIFPVSESIPFKKTNADF